MKDKKRILYQTVCACIIVLVVVYAVIFGYLNMAKLVEHADSDTAAEVLLAKEIWEEKDLSPDNWMSSTERKIVSCATVAALFYGCGIPMNTAMSLTCVVCGAAVMASFIYLLRAIGLKKAGMFTAVLLLLCVPINAREVSDSMLPFFTYLTFLFADYYAPHIIMMLLSLTTYFRLRKGEFSWSILISGGIAAMLSLALGASSIRCLQVAIGPMILLEAVEVYQVTDKFTQKLPPKRWYAIGYVLLMLVSNVLGMCYPSSANQPMYVLDGSQVAGRLFGDMPAALLKCLGIAGGSPLMSFGGLMQICVYLFVGLTVLAYFFQFQHKATVKKEQISATTFFLFNLLCTCFAVTVTSIAPYHYYFFIVFFLLAVALGCLADLLAERYHVLWVAFSIFVCGYALANLAYTYVPAMTSDSRQTEVKEVADFLEDAGIEFAYAQYWNANRLTIVSEGEVTMGGIYDMSNLEMYWWLTNVNWYPPNLPVALPTAYVVTPAEEAGFLAGVGDAQVTKAFSNEKFIVYTSETNLVNQ
uniref:hypothetical protein n=1 Tax=Acetatifactor sp. TaxID=1872090 RepID=UPI0040574DA1